MIFRSDTNYVNLKRNESYTYLSLILRIIFGAHYIQWKLQLVWLFRYYFRDNRLNYFFLENNLFLLHVYK